jgi:hypothetical protein
MGSLEVVMNCFLRSGKRVCDLCSVVSSHLSLLSASSASFFFRTCDLLLVQLVMGGVIILLAGGFCECAR